MAHATWNAELYDESHSFVWKRAGEVLELLGAQPGERVVDLGSGTGHLSHALSERGVEVIGVDASEDMVSKARESYPGLRFALGDGRTFEVGAGFDAVFSNAAIHWMREQDRVFARAFAHLRPGGRFVFEMGGARNLQAVREALELALRDLGAPEPPASALNTYLGVAQACALLDRAGFEVVHAVRVERPTPLDGEQGLRKWIQMFGGAWLACAPDAKRERFLELAEARGRPRLWRDGKWVADYVRLRVKALRPG